MFNLVNLNSKSVGGIVVAALAAAFIYWVYTKAQANSAAATAANNATADASGDLYGGAASTSGLTQLALLSALFGSNATQASQQTLSTTQPTYTAPGSDASGPGGTNGLGGISANIPSATVSTSSVGNSPVNQL